MSLTKKANENAVTSIADNDLVMVVGPQGGLHPISFANLMAAVKGGIQIGGRNYIPNSNFAKGISDLTTTAATLTLISDSYEGKSIRFGNKALMLTRTGNDSYINPMPIGKLQAGVKYTLTLWGRQAGTITNHSSYILVDGTPTIPINTLFDNQNNYAKKSITFTIPKASTSSALEYRDVKLRIGFLSTSSAWMLIEAMKLEQGTVATDWTPAPEDIASGLWGGVIGYLPITYNFGEKGGAHEPDERPIGCAEISADCHLAFGSLDAACEFIGRACEVNERFTNSNVSSMRGCGYCITRLDEDRSINSASSKRRQRRVHSYSLLRRSCKNAILLPVPESSGDLGKAPNFRGRLGELESVIAYGKEVTYAD